MKFRNIILLLFATIVSLASCSDDESFTLSPSRLLTFSADSIKLDTLFSNVPSRTKDFWVYNRSGEGIRCTNIRLERGNQSGFRVNVDGSYLGAAVGFQTSNVELRNKDSIRIFVEATTPYNHQDKPQLVEDNLLFTLESGVTQKVNLNAYSWDAQLLNNVHIEKDSVLTSNQKPIVIYGGLTVDSMATLTLPAGTTLYFHADAGIDVYGRLLALGEPDMNVTLRGDRIDRMFNDLPYDMVSGQWQGVRFHTSSYDNLLQYTDIHSTFDGVVVDSSNVNRNTLTMLCSTIHNCQGFGLHSVNSRINLVNCQLTNTLNDCLFVDGGHAELNACTLAQFYPFHPIKGTALHFSSVNHDLLQLACHNSLITGYADSEMIGEVGDSTTVFNYLFSHCIIRDTTHIEYVDTINTFQSVIFEDPTDTTIVYGKKHFVSASNYIYDFQLDSISPAIGKADLTTAPSNDRRGTLRDELPDIGAFEWKPTTNQQ